MKKEIKKLLLSLPTDLKEKLQKEADMQHRTFNGYIVWLLANRSQKKKQK